MSMSVMYFLSESLDCSYIVFFNPFSFLSSVKRATTFNLPRLSRTMGINRVLNEISPDLVSDLFRTLMTWARYFVPIL